MYQFLPIQLFIEPVKTWVWLVFFTPCSKTFFVSTQKQLTRRAVALKDQQSQTGAVFKRESRIVDAILNGTVSLLSLHCELVLC